MDRRSVHYAYMAKKSQKVLPRPKQRQLRRTFIKEWRVARGLSQERLAERVTEYFQRNGIDGSYTYASIGRIENRKMAYTQPVLEAIADALNVDVASLLMRRPGPEGSMWSIWDQAGEGERALIENLARTVVSGKTGTDG